MWCSDHNRELTPIGGDVRACPNCIEDEVDLLVMQLAADGEAADFLDRLERKLPESQWQKLWQWAEEAGQREDSFPERGIFQALVILAYRRDMTMPEVVASVIVSQSVAELLTVSWCTNGAVRSSCVAHQTLLELWHDGTTFCSGCLSALLRQYDDEACAEVALRLSFGLSSDERDLIEWYAVMMAHESGQDTDDEAVINRWLTRLVLGHALRYRLPLLEAINEVIVAGDVDLLVPFNWRERVKRCFEEPELRWVVASLEEIVSKYPSYRPKSN